MNNMRKLCILYGFLFIIGCNSPKINKLEPPIILMGVSENGDVSYIDNNKKVIIINWEEREAKIIANMYNTYEIQKGDTLIP